MDNLSTFQKVALIFIFGFLPVLLIWATAYSFWYKNRNVSNLIAQSGWKHQLIRKGTVERRFSSTANGIDWTIDFRISRGDSELQLSYPTILEWHTSTVKLFRGAVVVIPVPMVDREAMELAYKVMLRELDVWLSENLSQYHIGSIDFQSRYMVMAETEECAQQVIDAAENTLLQWPEREVSRLVEIPIPVLMADTNGISIRINLHRLGVPSNVQKLDDPFIHRIFAIVRLGVETAARIRDLT